MRAGSFRWVIAGLICLLSLLPGIAGGRVYFRISFGSPAIYNRSGFYPCYYPYYRWHRYPTRITGIRGITCYYPRYYRRHRCYYRWIDRDWYNWLDRYQYGDSYFFRYSDYYDCYYWRRYPCTSGVSIWIRNWYPGVVNRPMVGVPIVLTRDKIIGRSGEYKYKTRYDEKTTKLFEQLRRKKDELLKEAKEGKKANRKEAIKKLAGFSYDDKVRKILEGILLSDPDPELRKEVAKSLGKVKNKKFLPALEKAKTADPNKGVRQEANKAIKRIREY